MAAHVGRGGDVVERQYSLGVQGRREPFDVLGARWSRARSEVWIARRGVFLLHWRLVDAAGYYVTVAGRRYEEC